MLSLLVMIGLTVKRNIRGLPAGLSSKWDITDSL